MRTFAKIIGYGLVVLLLVATVGFTYKFTNGFNEDLKTFYIEYNGKQILTTENKMTFEKGAVHRFDVKYTFDMDDAEPKGYKVKIVTNMTKDFDYTVDGERYLFSKVGDITAAFEPILHDTFFELYLPESLSFSEILKKANNGNSVSVPSDAFTNNPYPFRLQVSSYNDKITYNIDFTFENSGQTSGGNSDNQNTPTTPTTPIVPDTPIEPTKESYAITYRIIGNEANLILADVICEPSAVEGETVGFAVSLIGDYKSEVTSITIYSGGKLWTTIEAGENDGASNFYKEYSFVMPDGDVEIAVTIKAIELSEYRNISYDTLGSGSYNSVILYCADVARPGDYIMASISLAFGVEDLEITRVVLQNADTGDEICELEQFNEFFDFTMPDCDIVILIYLMPSEKTSTTPTTPTPPTGATHSIIYSATYYGYDANTFDFCDFVSVSCPLNAKSGEKVTVTIKVIESFAELYEITDVMISYTEMEFSYAFAVSKGNGVYEFTMPDFDMQLYIYVGDRSYM